MDRPLYRTAGVRELEARLGEEHGLGPALLMQRAGAALFAQVRCHWPRARNVLVLAGSGNNGGDGYVLARLLHGHGAEVQVLAPAPARAGEAVAAARAWHEAGGRTQVWEEGTPLPEADLLVDALLGIGLSRAPDTRMAALIAAINAHPAPVLAVDVPSGLDADTGHAPGAVVRADRTLCLLARKRGLYTGDARDVTGVVAFDDLQAPVDGIVAAQADLLDRADLAAVLPRRRPNTHKGEQGHVLVVGGDLGMSGAVRLAGLAALRSGAGLVSVATRAEHAGVVAGCQPELMVHGVEDAGALATLLRRASVLAVGPGLGQGEWGRTMLDAVLASDLPAVVDADALNLLAQQPRRLGHHRIITPHPGEAARLLSVDNAAIAGDRYGAGRALADRYGCITVLKGAGSLVDDGTSTAVCPYGNPGMASGGMGDVLTGIIAALLGQGLSPRQAARAGVLAHALAGDLAAGDMPRSLIATDLVAQLRPVLNP